MPDKEARDKLFRKFDVDGGGSISLEEARPARTSATPHRLRQAPLA